MAVNGDEIDNAVGEDAHVLAQAIDLVAVVGDIHHVAAVAFEQLAQL